MIVCGTIFYDQTNNKIKVDASTTEQFLYHAILHCILEYKHFKPTEKANNTAE
jgi:hypothetical protein